MKVGGMLSTDLNHSQRRVIAGVSVKGGGNNFTDDYGKGIITIISYATRMNQHGYGNIVYKIHNIGRLTAKILPGHDMYCSRLKESHDLQMIVK